MLFASENGKQNRPVRPRSLPAWMLPIWCICWPGRAANIRGQGIIKHDVEETIAAVGRLASRGMRTTDAEIPQIMLE